MPSMDERIAQYERLIRRVLRAAGCPVAWQEDGLQEARIGVWRALLTYRPGPCRESTWVWRRVFCHIVDWLRHAGLAHGRSARGGMVARVLSLDAPCGDDEGPPTSIHNLVTVDDLSESVASRAVVAAFARGLTPTERTVLRCLLCGYRPGEIAHLRGVRPSAVSFHRSKIRRKWRAWEEVQRCAS